MNDPKGGVAKITCPTFEAMGQIPMFHRTYFLLQYNRVKLSCRKDTARRSTSRESGLGVAKGHWKLYGLRDITALFV